MTGPYFKNEIWDTGGDGRITVLGDLYGPDPFTIFTGNPPVPTIEMENGNVNIPNDLNVDGNFHIGGFTSFNNIEIRGDLEVGGNATLNSLRDIKVSQLARTLNVVGSFTINGNHLSLTPLFYAI